MRPLASASHEPSGSGLVLDSDSNNKDVIEYEYENKEDSNNEELDSVAGLHQ